MKKILSILVVLILLLTGCSSNAQPTPAEVLIAAADKLKVETTALHLDASVDTTIDGDTNEKQFVITMMDLDKPKTDQKIHAIVRQNELSIEAHIVEGIYYMNLGPLKIKSENATDFSSPLDLTIFENLTEGFTEENKKEINQQFKLSKENDNYLISMEVTEDLNHSFQSTIREISGSEFASLSNGKLIYTVSKDNDLIGLTISSDVVDLDEKTGTIMIRMKINRDPKQITFESPNPKDYKLQSEMTEEDYGIFFEYLSSGM